MRHIFSSAMIAFAGLSIATVAPAAAKCTKLAFEVNDYGKDGPTRDAKALLDTYIAKWTAERGIKKYHVGKKDVTCELFLNLIVFDEHTCKAAATVCWSGDGPATTAAAKPAAATAGADAKPAKATAQSAAAKPAKAKAAAPGAASSDAAKK